MKISFDWDSTLAEDRQQRIAKKFLEEGHELWIVTTRSEKPPTPSSWDNKPLFRVAEKLGIPVGRIIFTAGQDKSKFLEGFDIHFEDDQVEAELIEENTSCVVILIYDP